jgi:hypothetical protein
VRVDGALSVSAFFVVAATATADHLKPPPLTLGWKDNILTISGDRLPGKELKILYLEVYCRPNSRAPDWSANTVIGHKTELAS